MSTGVEAWTGYFVGAAVFGCAFALAIQAWQKRGLEKELRNKGYSVVARITGVVRSDEEGEGIGYAIDAEYYDQRRGRIYKYASARIAFDPAPFLKNRPEILVFIDRHDPGRYVMDTSFLPDH